MSERLTEASLLMARDYAVQLMESRHDRDALSNGVYGAMIYELLDELRTRRAVDLTAEERGALVVLAERNRCAMHGTRCTDVLCAETQAGVAVLDRLLSHDSEQGGR